MRISALALMATMTGVALSAATPAAAQIAGRHDYGSVARPSPFLPDSSLPLPPIHGDLRQARERIERLEDEGRITRREARALRREAGWIGTLARRYGRDGLSDAERRELETRTQALQAGVGRR